MALSLCRALNEDILLFGYVPSSQRPGKLFLSPPTPTSKHLLATVLAQAQGQVLRAQGWGRCHHHPSGTTIKQTLKARTSFISLSPHSMRIVKREPYKSLWTEFLPQLCLSLPPEFQPMADSQGTHFQKAESTEQGSGRKIAMLKLSPYLADVINT